MNKKEAEDYIYKSYLKAQQYQDYSIKDSQKRRSDLTFEIIRKQSETPCVVITGSKGKGSVANMISQILQTEYNVGMMTSPHIEDFCERFRVNGEKILNEDFIRNIELIQNEIDSIDASISKDICISPMGIQAYLALNYFKNKETDFNIFECGKGAKYDDVNNIKHDFAVINSIFLEHKRELGDTVEEIAKDKSYVITGEQKYVYVAEQIPSIMNIIQQRANDLNVNLKIYGKDFEAKNIRYTKEGIKFDIIVEKEIYPDIVLPLLGEHQAKNCSLAFALCKDVLESLNLKKKKSEVSNSEFIHRKSRIEDIKLKKIKDNLFKIQWPGRMEIISKDPFIILDACINKISCKNVIDILENIGIKQSIFIIGIPEDKDYVGVAETIQEKASQIILTKSQNPHYIFTKKQQENLNKIGIHVNWTESVSEAINYARKEDNPIIILGTTSLVAEVKKLKL